MAVTFAQYREATPDAVWFAGTGVALILLAGINWAAWGDWHPASRVRRLVLLLDGACTLGGIIAVRAIQEPQAFVLLATFAGMLMSGAAMELRRSNRRT